MRPARADGGFTVSHIPWESNYEAALERARSERKFVFLDIFNPG
jgi:hypothetical protein